MVKKDSNPFITIQLYFSTIDIDVLLLALCFLDAYTTACPSVLSITGLLASLICYTSKRHK